MELQDVYFVSEIVAAIAVVASLIFVGFQLRQNTTAVRYDAGQRNASSFQSMTMTVAANDDLLNAWRSGNNSEKDWSLEQSRLVFMLNAFLKVNEENYLQWLDGNLSDELWEAHRASMISGFVSQPAYEQYWSGGMNINFTKRFQAFVDDHFTSMASA
jgi:hypothetical protein